MTVVAPAFFTPRIDMQKCSASMTTIEPRGLQFVLHGFDDLGRHAFLDLESAGESLDEARQLRQSRDATFGTGEVGDVRHAHERDEVMLAERREGDVANHHHLVVTGFEGHAKVFARVRFDAFEELDVHVGDATRGLEQTLAIGSSPMASRSSRTRPFTRSWSTTFRPRR